MKAFRLAKKDMVGICAPSGVVKKNNIIDFHNSEKILSKYDIKPIYSKNIFSNSLGYSATVKEKVEDLNTFIIDKKIKAIIFAKGGSNSNSILPFINYDGIKNNPKIFMGFSDNTVLLNAIYKKTGLITYHFTNYKGFCEQNLEFNLNQFEKSFIQGKRGIVEQNSSWKCLRKGIASGKLVGGNLCSLVKIINTEYCPSFKNKILFLEDLAIESDVEMVSSYLYQLKNSKVFDVISGLLIGYYDSQDSYSFEDVIMDVIKEYDFPVLKCDDFGHNATNIVIPIGLKCTLDSNNNRLIYEEKTVK